MAESYQDAMAIARYLGPPQFFVTMTANPNWPELKNALLPGQVPADQPDLAGRFLPRTAQPLPATTGLHTPPVSHLSTTPLLSLEPSPSSSTAPSLSSLVALESEPASPASNPNRFPFPASPSTQPTLTTPRVASSSIAPPAATNPPARKGSLPERPLPSLASLIRNSEPAAMTNTDANADLRAARRALADDVTDFDDEGRPCSEEEWRYKFLRATREVTPKQRAELWADKLAFKGKAYNWLQAQKKDTTNKDLVGNWTTLEPLIEARWPTPVYATILADKREPYRDPDTGRFAKRPPAEPTAYPTPAQSTLFSSPVRVPGTFSFLEREETPTPASRVPFPAGSPFEFLPELPPSSPARSRRSVTPTTPPSTMLEQGPPPVSAVFVAKLQAVQNPNAFLPELVDENNADTQARYRADVLRYQELHGDREPFFNRPYPLSPGTRRQTLDLCTKCAKGNHPNSKCPAESKSELVPENERLYRDMLVSDLRKKKKSSSRAGVQWNTPTPAPRPRDVNQVEVNQVEVVEESEALWEQYGYESGNEQGRRA
ncbi:Helitron helicase-like domain at N-terminus [Ceratobasidium sp. AG-Ba]|nr:Helitron helicase-like domain at N-terminus [Ceratobasidium sp. AG-Ba]